MLEKNILVIQWEWGHRGKRHFSRFSYTELGIRLGVGVVGTEGEEREGKLCSQPT